MKNLLLTLGIVSTVAFAATPLIPVFDGTFSTGTTYRTRILQGVNAKVTNEVIYESGLYVNKGDSASQPTKGTRPDHDGSWRKVAGGAV